MPRAELSAARRPVHARRDLRALLGEDFVTVYAAMRRHELQRFDDHVTDWELAEYAELF